LVFPWFIWRKLWENGEEGETESTEEGGVFDAEIEE
jgi:hypothetical protein